MRTLLIAATIALSANAAANDGVHYQDYTREDGIYVVPH
jgi:hypothetical protein